MSNRDAAALAKLAIELRLVRDEQIDECRDESGSLGSDGQGLLRTLERKGYLTPFQTHKLLKGDQDGYFLGGYRLLYKIASGSFGRVFRADDPQTRTIVAVKVLRRRWTGNPHSVDLFEREAKLGMALRHPNIVTILSIGKDPLSQQYYIVMEFVEGGNLRDFLAIRKKLEPAEALRLLEEATSGLAYAFSKGVTHRDMKLTNILISAQGGAKLVDFGLAGFSASDEGEGDHVDRSVDYAGLEKASGVRSGDVRSDIYFLGCVFYEMLTGRSPLLMTKDKHVRQQKERFLNVPAISGTEVTAPRQVFELLETMMSLDPQRRYQTPTQLLDAVRAARQVVEARSPGVPRKVPDEIKPRERTPAADDVGPREVQEAVSAAGVDSGRRAGLDADSAGQPTSAAAETVEAVVPQTAAAAAPSERPIVYLVESHQKIQGVIRDKLTELGYEVHLENDPDAAAAKYRQSPCQALIVDAGPAGPDAVACFEQAMTESRRRSLDSAGILILSENQAGWAVRVTTSRRVVVMVRPVTLKQLTDKLCELVAPPKSE
jgi:serine/threonine protein kinase